MFQSSEMHQYLDSDDSGTSATCVSTTIGAERLAAATQWLQANNLKGFLGEIGGGSNSVCITAIQGALCSMQQSNVWLGQYFHLAMFNKLTWKTTYRRLVVGCWSLVGHSKFSIQ